MSNATFYDDIYNQVYDAGYRNNDKCNGGMFIQELCDKYKFRSVLDAGCSTGRCVKFFSELGRQAIGIDVARRAIEIAQMKQRPCYLGNILNLLFPDAFFDLVFCADVMEHFREEDVQQALQEMYRVSKRYIAMQIATRKSKGRWEKVASLPIENLHLTLWHTKQWRREFEKLNIVVLFCEHRQVGKGDHIYALLEKKV